MSLVAGDVLVEVEVDHINGETFFTLLEQENEKEERHRPMMGSPKPMVVVRVSRGLSPGPPAQNSSALPTEIIEMDQNGLGRGGSGERGDA